MDTQLPAIFYSLVTLFSWGFENALSKKYSRRLSPSKLVIYRNIVTVFITMSALLVFWKQTNFVFPYILLGFFIAIIAYIGYYFFLKGLETGNLAIVSPISSSRILIATLVGLTFLKDTIKPIQIFFIVIVFFGVALSSFNFRSIRDSGFFDKKSGIPFALLNALIWGIVVPFYSLPSAVLGAFLFSAILETTGLVSSLIQTNSTNKAIILTKTEFKDNGLGLFIIGLSGGLGSIFLNLGYSTGHIGIVSAISSAVPLVAVTYGKFIYKEKLTTAQYSAIALMITGIICLTYFR